MSDLIAVLTRDENGKSKALVADNISSDYQGRELIFNDALDCASIYLSNPARQLSIPVKIDFLRAANYGSNSSISGKIQRIKDLKIDIRQKDVWAEGFTNPAGVFKQQK